jgi:hypothetical protein
MEPSPQLLKPLLTYCTSPWRRWVWCSRWNDWQEKPKYSEKTCPSAALSTTNPTWPDPDRRDRKPATDISALLHLQNVPVISIAGPLECNGGWREWVLMLHLGLAFLSLEACLHAAAFACGDILSILVLCLRYGAVNPILRLSWPLQPVLPESASAGPAVRQRSHAVCSSVYITFCFHGGHCRAAANCRTVAWLYGSFLKLDLRFCKVFQHSTAFVV